MAQPGQPAFALLHRQRVEQRLGRMLVHAVARVDDAGAADLRELGAGAGRVVPHDDHVGRHRFERPRGVGERLALGDARAGGGHAEGVGAQALLGELERHARARARLEEEVDDGPAAQRRDFLDRARTDFLHRQRGLEDQVDLVRLEVGDAEQMPAAEARGDAHPSTSTSSRPSISARRTCTLCWREVGMLRPT
jgi:hypothetical protein